MKIMRIIAVAAVLAVFAAGCESFRDGNDGGGSEKRSSGRGKKSSGRRKSKRSRDPRDDMFFGVGSGGKAESFSRDSLSPREQSLLDEELRREDEEMKELRRRRRNMDPDRSKRKEWVYGFKPLGGDK